MVLFHYKFDFMDNGIGHARPNSMMSREYELRIK
jgi:hypothetical protein